MKRIALILIGHLKPEWKKLSEEEQAGFAARVRRAAKAAGVTLVVGYTLTTQGSFLEIWEADDKSPLEVFKQKLDALGYKNYYDEVLMVGERDSAWLDGLTKSGENISEKQQ
ncbi:MAG: hypothetical protein HY741_01250 [Chloroflexi bacterium]|nr:hypothetical protein [Chloroflexota bacterium]